MSRVPARSSSCTWHLQVPARKTGSCPVWSKHPVLHRGGQRYSDSGCQERMPCCIGCGAAGVMGRDVHAMVVGRIVNHSLSLESLGVTSNCTVSFFSPLRSGSRDNVPGQWTCSNCLAERCWPVRIKCYQCGAPRHADSAPWNDKKGRSCSSEGTQLCAAHYQQSATCSAPAWRPALAGVGDPPLPIPPDATKSSEDMANALKLLQNVIPKRTSLSMRRW